MNRAKLLLLSTALALLALPSVASADRWTARAKELSKLRAEVEDVEGKIARERASANAELKALTQQKGELALLLRKEQLTLATLRKQRERLALRLKSTKGQRRAIVPAVLAAASELRLYLTASLPFARDKRLAALDRIVNGLKAETLAPRAAAGQLWQLLEDELKLCRETGLHQQAVSLDGKRVLADIARLGMVALYFRTSDGRVGRAAKTAKGYRYVVSSGAARRGVTALFEALKKQLRSGLFQLPVDAAPRGGKR
jgi:hypothetical protein